MRIAVMGTGGLGSYIGGRLAYMGADVTFIARGQQLQAITQKGIQVQSNYGGFAVAPVQATSNPAEVEPVDLILFCVKSYDAEAAICGAAGVFSVVRSSAGPIAQTLETLALVHQAVAECVAVAQSRQISLSPALPDQIVNCVSWVMVNLSLCRLYQYYRVSNSFFMGGSAFTFRSVVIQLTMQVN